MNLLFPFAYRTSVFFCLAPLSLCLLNILHSFLQDRILINLLAGLGTCSFPLLAYMLLKYCCFCFVESNRMGNSIFLWGNGLLSWPQKQYNVLWVLLSYPCSEDPLKNNLKGYFKVHEKNVQNIKRNDIVNKGVENVLLTECVSAIVLNAVLWYSCPTLTQENECSAFIIRFSCMGVMNHNSNPWYMAF